MVLPWFKLGGHDDENGIDTIENQLLKKAQTKGFQRILRRRVTNSDHRSEYTKLFLDLNLELKRNSSTNLCFVRSPMESKYRSLSDQKTPRQQRNEDNEMLRGLQWPTFMQTKVYYL